MSKRKYNKDSKIVFTMSTGYVGSEWTETFSLKYDLDLDPEEYTDDEIDKELAKELEAWIWENLDCGFYPEEEDDDED